MGSGASHQLPAKYRKLPTSDWSNRDPHEAYTLGLCTPTEPMALCSLHKKLHNLQGLFWLVAYL